VKGFAFNQAKGDIQIEMDHDDMLTPHAISAIVDAFQDPAVEFVYSNFAEFWDKTWEPLIYNKEYGWEHKPREFYGHQFIESRTFPPSPLSFRHVNFAPNHVRAWRSDAYRAIGGHDPKMAIADDHDLCCRFYLHGKLHWIDDCLYLYRNFPEQSWRERAPSAFEKSFEVNDKYGVQMVEHWCDLNGYPKIDLGSACAKERPAGYQTVDRRAGVGVDYVADLETGVLPFETSSVGVIRAYDLLEHIRNVVPLMNEIYRVLVPGGWLLSQTPSTDGRGAFQDPTHVSFWNSNSFWYYTKAFMAGFVPEINCRFQAVRVRNLFPNENCRIHNIPYVYADLVAIKGGMRTPGLVEI
jgi:hypothetical protein